MGATATQAIKVYFIKASEYVKHKPVREKGDPEPISFEPNKADVAIDALRANGILPIVANDVYIPHFNRPEFLQIIYGGTGGGKSDWKATDMLLKALVKPYFRCKYLRRFESEARSTQTEVFKDLIKRYRLEQYFNVRQNPSRITCTINDNFLEPDGFDNVDALLSLPDYTDIWVEEPVDRKGGINKDQIRELMRRVRTTLASNHIHFTFNPIRKETDIYREFWENPSYMNEGKLWTLNTTFRDNAFRTKEENDKFRMMEANDPDGYKVYGLGQWGTLKQGLIYPDAERISAFPADATHVGYGIDFGYDPDPTTVILCGMWRGFPVFHELIYEHRLTMADLSNRMYQLGVNKRLPMVSDIDKEKVEQLRRFGWSIEFANKGAHSVVPGINKLKSYGKIYVTSGSTNMWREQGLYQWDTTGNLREGDRPRKSDHEDHTWDAARYYGNEYFPIPGVNRMKPQRYESIRV